MDRVSIIILHWKDLSLTQSCLKSLNDLSCEDLAVNVLVVNNGSSDPVEKLKCKLPLRIVSTSENLGYAGGNNFGIKIALEEGAKYLWILNNDTEVDKDSLSKAINSMSNESIGIVGPKIYFAPGYEYHKDWYKKDDIGRVIWWAGGKIDLDNVANIHSGLDQVDRGQFSKSYEVDTVTGTAMIVRREVFEKIGLLDETYYLYFEESDFCMRARKVGFKLWYCADSVVWHKNAGSSGVGSTLHDYFITRNQLQYGFKYFTLRTKFALIRQSVRIFFEGRKWQKIGVRDFFLRKMGKGSFKFER